VVGSALILPWVIVAMGRAVLGGTDPLTLISWMKPPQPLHLVWYYVSVFGRVPVIQTRWLLLILACLAVAYLKSLVASKSLPTSHVLLFLIAAGLPTSVYALSVWGSKPIFVERQLLGAAIAFIAAIGLGLAALPRTLAAGLLLALVAWTATALPQGLPSTIKPPWREIAAQIDQQYGTMGVAVQEVWIRDPLEHYRQLGPVQLWSAPPELAARERWLFLCRPTDARCSQAESEPLKSRRFLVETRRWGSESSEQQQLHLYEIREPTRVESNEPLPDDR
jgi:hypothetical protein